MSDFVKQVDSAMQGYFGEDQRRIEHALAVVSWAETLLDYIDAERLTTLCAAYLHDIGILEAERKHQSCAGHFQEIEGPPVAREILFRLKADVALTDRVCELVGRHHTPNGVDSPEFRILWDADALVNLEETAPHKSVKEIASVLHKSFVTEAGYRLAMKKYLPVETLAPHLQPGLSS